MSLREKQKRLQARRQRNQFTEGQRALTFLQKENTLMSDPTDQEKFVALFESFGIPLAYDIDEDACPDAFFKRGAQVCISPVAVVGAGAGPETTETTSTSPHFTEAATDYYFNRDGKFVGVHFSCY